MHAKAQIQSPIQTLVLVHSRIPMITCCYPGSKTIWTVSVLYSWLCLVVLGTLGINKNIYIKGPLSNEPADRQYGLELGTIFGAKLPEPMQKVVYPRLLVYRQLTNAAGIGNLPQTDRHVFTTNYDAVRSWIDIIWELGLNSHSLYVLLYCFNRICNSYEVMRFDWNIYTSKGSNKFFCFRDLNSNSRST